MVVENKREKEAYTLFGISKAAGSPDYIVRYEKLRRRLYLGQPVEALRAFVLVNLMRGKRTGLLLDCCYPSPLALILEIESLTCAIGNHNLNPSDILLRDVTRNQIIKTKAINYFFFYYFDPRSFTLLYAFITIFKFLTFYSRDLTLKDLKFLINQTKV